MKEKQRCITKRPAFDFNVPLGYDWLLEQGLVGFVSFSALQPWYYLDSAEYFNVTQQWPTGPYTGPGQLIAFADRQDCDDMACFEVVDGTAKRIFLIHGWVDVHYDIDAVYEDFWEWLKSVIDDIAIWAAL